jgi:hypothetical protein
VDAAQDTAEVAKLLAELESLLRARGERNWIRGVTAAKQAAEAGSLADARSIYTSMTGGNGSFSDYYIHDDDFDTRVRLNEPLDRLRERIWTALMRYLNEKPAL